MNSSMANGRLWLIVILLLSSVVMGQEKIRPCECIPCGGQIECQPGSTSWCECRNGKCFGGCLLPDRNPRRLAASVLTVVTSPENDIPPDSLQQNSKEFAGILSVILKSKVENGTHRIKFEDRKIGFVFTQDALSQLSQVLRELESGQPSPSQTPSPLPAQPVPESQISIRALLRRLSWFGILDLIILSLMAIRFLVIVIERYITYTLAKKQSREFAPRVAEAIKNDQISEAIKICQSYRQSHLAMVVRSGLQEFSADESSDIEMFTDKLKASKRAMLRAVAIKDAEFKRGLSALTTVGWSASQLGLLGLIFGIIQSAQSVVVTKSIYSADGASGILEGLWLLFIGTALRIGAHWWRDYFASKVSGFTVEMENTVSELEDYFQRARFGNTSSVIRTEVA